MEKQNIIKSYVGQKSTDLQLSAIKQNELRILPRNLILRKLNNLVINKKLVRAAIMIQKTVKMHLTRKKVKL